MRKKLVTIAGVLVVLAALCMVEYGAVKGMTSEGLIEMEQILKAVRLDDLEMGLEQARKLNAFWDKRARGLDMLADHSDADAVRSGLQKLIAALESGDRSMAIVYAHEVKGSIEHVRERQALSIQNVL